MLSAATVQIEQSDSQPLAAVLRSRIDGDAELRRLRDELKAHLYRGIAWWDTDRQQIAARRLRQLAPGLPPVVQPVALATVAAQLAGDPYYPHAHDVQAAMMSHRYRGRLAAVLVEYFRQLQGGGLVATGRIVINPVTSTFIPHELWSAKATAVDALTGDVLVGDTRAFIDVTVSSPPTRSPSRAAITRFIRAFDEAMRDAERRYTVDELATAAQALGNVSGAEIEAALRRSPVSARAGAGRRAAHEVPTEAELASAASRAAEASSNPA